MGFAIGFGAFVMSLVAYTMRRLQFDKKVIALAVLALAMSILHISQTKPSEFAVDLQWHSEYIKIIGEEKRLPKSGEIAAHYHLPTYYWLTYPFYHIGKWLGEDPFWTPRLTSFAIFAVFLVVAACFVRRMLKRYDEQYYFIGAALVVLWPVGVLFSARLHPEVLGYIGHLGLFYAIFSWLYDRQKEAFIYGLIFAGIFSLSRNYAAFFLVIFLGFMAHGMYLYRHRLKEFFTWPMVLAIIFCIVCYVTSAMHREVMPNTEPVTQLGKPKDFEWLFYTFLYFNPWLYFSETGLSPNIGDSLDHHLHYFIRSSVLGGFTDWENWPVAFALNTIWMLTVFYTLLIFPLYVYRKLSKQDKIVYGWVMFFIAMMSGMSMAARYFHPMMPTISDVRYVYPAVILVLLCFMRSVIHFRTQGKKNLASLGSGLAFGLIGLSVALFVGEHVVF